MAFVVRAERGTDFIPKTATGTDVGPGSYLKLSGHKKRHGYAPFASTAERKVGAAPSGNVSVPGPGAYIDPDHGKEESKELAAATGSAFLNRENRFKKKADMTPGPGQYAISQKWVKEQPSQVLAGGKAKERPVTWVRVPTAPSIPAPTQSYGYEESATGELIMQKSPNQGYTGKGIDKPAPNNYVVNDTPLHKKAPAVNFGSSKSKRGFQETKNLPGPGYYEHEVQEAALATAPARMSSNFQSKSLRGFQRGVDEEKIGPGPGQYEHKQGFRAAYVPESLQFFGTTSKRGFQTDSKDYSAPFSTKTPGPGQYEERRQGFQKPKVHIHANRENVGFTSRADRFGGSKSNPVGPGQYNNAEVVSLVNDVAKKVVGRAGVFGSTAKRFGGKQGYKVPGPGAYETVQAPEAPAPGERPFAPSSVFASSTERFKKMTTDRTPKPPVGSYELNQAWGTESKRKPLMRGVPSDEMFMSRSERFPKTKVFGSKLENTPGPGAYNGKKHIDTSTKTRLDVFNTSASRFKDSRSLGPGPGAYDYHMTPQDSLIQRSFNVTVEGAF